MGVRDAHAPSGAKLVNVERSRSLGMSGGCPVQRLDQETLDLLGLMAAIEDSNQDVHATQRYYDDGTIVIDLPTEDDERE